jgi:hypothetical protein
VAINPSITPNETGSNGKPVTWVGATGTSATPGGPTVITLAVATVNYPSDQGFPPFSSPFPAAFVPLLQAAEEVYESVANIQFVNVPDAANAAQAPDIRVGLADLTKDLGQPAASTFVTGYTRVVSTASDKLVPDTLVTIDDPSELGITQLVNGNFQYNGIGATVFQDMLHELGHSLGLAHNTTDVHAIMNPTLTASNPVPDAQDIAALQNLYGAAKPGSLVLTQPEMATLNGLIPGLA